MSCLLSLSLWQCGFRLQVDLGMHISCSYGNAHLRPTQGVFTCRCEAHHDCCRFDGVIPSGECEAAQPALAELNSKLGPLVQQYVALMERIKLKDGIRQAMNVSFAGNKFFQASRSLLPCFLKRLSEHSCHSVI